MICRCEALASYTGTLNGDVSMEVLSSSCGKTGPDYGLKKDSHKRDLIARTPHLLSNAKECGAR
jgi:hypothetical protein